jgi:hypothetical protein
MISQLDIDHWTDEDFSKVVDEIPEADKTFIFREESDGEIVMDMGKFLTAYGRTLHKLFKRSTTI